MEQQSTGEPSQVDADPTQNVTVDAGSAASEARPKAQETSQEAAAAPEQPKPKGRMRSIWDGTGDLIESAVFPNLLRRIVTINLIGLVILVVGILYFNQWRDGLIEARVQSLRVQGEIISAAIAASATVDSNVITVNPDRLLQLQGDAPLSPLSFFDPALEFPINPERVAPLLRNLVSPTKTRARIYDKDGLLILDSNSIYLTGEVLRSTIAEESEDPFYVVWWDRIVTFVPGDTFSIYQEYASDEGKRYPEVAAALTGAPADIVRVDSAGDLIVSVSVPVQRLRATVGALLLSTEPGEIDAIVAQERISILRIALVAVAVTIGLSIFLASTIAGPMRRLSSAAEQVQASMSARTQIPDYTDRRDEIGHLSGSLRAMTASLFDRIHAIESFAADVAHELKNPLTSLRSAVETLPLVKTQDDRSRLEAIIQHDVQRLDRLISDISNASRLDAELARDATETFDLQDIVLAMLSMQTDQAQTRNIQLRLVVNEGQTFPVRGHDSRLAQVVTNLIDNAISFSPEGGLVDLSLTKKDGAIVLRVRDAGRGLAENADKIFSRFYTDRPDGENFGDHSGLGLSISRQIVEAHRGKIWAENRADQSGAIFYVSLPMATKQASQ